MGCIYSIANEAGGSFLRYKNLLLYPKVGKLPCYSSSVTLLKKRIKKKRQIQNTKIICIINSNKKKQYLNTASPTKCAVIRSYYTNIKGY